VAGAPTATPTSTATPTRTATADLRGADAVADADRRQSEPSSARSSRRCRIRRAAATTTVEIIRDGDFPPLDSTDSQRQYDTWDGVNTAAEDWIGYVYPRSTPSRRIVFQVGINFSDGGGSTR
jgi:hypothetical protein